MVGDDYLPGAPVGTALTGEYTGNRPWQTRLGPCCREMPEPVGNGFRWRDYDAAKASMMPFRVGLGRIAALVNAGSGR